MNKNFWKISTFVLLAIIVAYIGFMLFMTYAYNEDDMELMVNPMADMPIATEAKYTENGERIITSKDLQLMMHQMNKAGNKVQKHVKEGMGAITGTVDEMNKAMDDPKSEINGFADSITAMVLAVQKELPALEKKIQILQSKIEAKIAESNKELQKFTPEKTSVVKTPNNK